MTGSARHRIGPVSAAVRFQRRGPGAGHDRAGLEHGHAEPFRPHLARFVPQAGAVCLGFANQPRAGGSGPPQVPRACSRPAGHDGARPDQARPPDERRRGPGAGRPGRRRERRRRVRGRRADEPAGSQGAAASGGNAGGWGHFTFGTFLVQVLGANGQLARQGLRQPLGVELHFGGRAGAVDVGHAVAVVNRPLPPWVSLDPAPAAVGQVPTPALDGPPVDARVFASRAPAADDGLGPSSKQRATVDPLGRLHELRHRRQRLHAERPAAAPTWIPGSGPAAAGSTSTPSPVRSECSGQRAWVG